LNRIMAWDSKSKHPEVVLLQWPTIIIIKKAAVSGLIQPLVYWYSIHTKAELL
jgi:hypothetical protein